MPKVTDSKIKGLFRKWMNRLKIKTNVFLTTNPKKYESITNSKVCKKRICVFGAVLLVPNRNPVVFISKKKNQIASELEKTVIHELLHIKFPKKTENFIRVKTNRVFQDA